MKLKKLLILAFATLTIVPALILSLLLYKSGLELSKESYTRNLAESIHVQSNLLSQIIEDDMISDLRFLQKNYRADLIKSQEIQRSDLLSAIQYYLESAEDRISVCVLLDQLDEPLYTIGESADLDYIIAQFTDFSELKGQQIVEFEMGDQLHSLGIITPIRDDSGGYLGSLVSVYDRLYLFKIISSYYEITDTSTYISSESGSVIDLNGYTSNENKTVVSEGLQSLNMAGEGSIDMKTGRRAMSGYYKNIDNTPWYLVGLIDQGQIYGFTNQFIWVYILIILAVVLAGVILSVGFSKRVVEPINQLIHIMDGYPDSLKHTDTQELQRRGYFETQYLQKKFLDLMKKIMLVQHNFEGVYQLYQSNDMGDINIDIDVINQTIHSNKELFSNLINGLSVPADACIVERFTRCFCDKDQAFLMTMFEGMRDEHLAVTQEGEAFTPHLGEKWFHILTVPMYEDERLSRLFIQLRDISNFKKQEYESMEQAKIEPLTGLLNRSGFTSHAERILSESSYANCHGILFIDINNFKLVNDNFGHGAGDDLLRSVAKSIKENVDGDDIASRFGGDEFAVFMPHTSAEAVQRMKTILEQCLVYSYSGETVSFVISASIGTAIWDQKSPKTLNELLDEADKAMYQQKRESKQKKGSGE